jgi:hypothetical protein
MENEKRTVRREVILTKAEAAEIDAAAQSEGMTGATFMRFAALRLARGAGQ